MNLHNSCLQFYRNTFDTQRTEKINNNNKKNIIHNMKKIKRFFMKKKKEALFNNETLEVRY